MNLQLGLGVILCGLFRLISAQSSLTLALAAELPNCAAQCLTTATLSSPCSIANQTCFCTDAPLQEAAMLCVSRNCTIKESLFTMNTTQTWCNVPIRSRSQQYAATTIAFAVVSALVVFVRLASKPFMKTKLSNDDWAILATVLICTPGAVLTLHGIIPNGFGKDIWTVSFDKITAFGRILFFMEIMYFISLTLLKLSLLLFYLRIFPNGGLRRLLWATVAFNLLFGVASVFVAIFSCSPISFAWERWDGEHQGTCLNINAFGWSNAAISIALDFWMLAIPLSQVSSLNLHWRQKVGVGLMFCVGTFVTVVSILRLQSFVKFGKSTNPTWDNSSTANWSTTEINVGIICACMPSLRLVLFRAFPRARSLFSHRSQQYNSQVGYIRSGSHTQIPARAVLRTQKSSIQGSKDSSEIMHQKSFVVQYSDEVSPVRMDDIDLETLSQETIPVCTSHILG